MTRLYIIAINIYLLFGFLSTTLIAQTTSIPDSSFEQALINLGIDSDGVVNTEVATADIENVISLDVSNYQIELLTGIEDFINLEILFAGSNIFTAAGVDLTNNNKLKELYIDHSQLTSIDLSGNPLLEILYVGNQEIDVGPFSDITFLDVSANPLLETLDFTYMSATIMPATIVLGNNDALKELRGSLVNIESINLNEAMQIEDLQLGSFTGPDYIQVSVPNLNLSDHLNLESVIIQNSDIQALSLKNGNNDTIQFIGRENDDLVCIEVDESSAAMMGQAPYDTWLIDDTSVFSEDCYLETPSYKGVELVIYPNPTTDNLYIDTSPDVFNTTIYNTSGKLVRTNNSSKTLDVSGLLNGVYFLEINTNQGKAITSFVKQ